MAKTRKEYFIEVLTALDYTTAANALTPIQRAQFDLNVDSINDPFMEVGW